MSRLWKKSVWGRGEQAAAQGRGHEALWFKQVQDHWERCLPLASVVSLVKLFRKPARTGQGISFAG